jgi:hypothetical protein
MVAIDINQCRNCGSALAPDQKHCGHCGQKSDTGRLTIEQLGHDLVHALTHVDKPNPVSDLLQRHANITFLIQVPVLALFCRLVFWRDGFNSAEFLVLAAYTVSMRTIFFGVVLVPLSGIFHPSQAAMVGWAYATILAWIAYFGFATSQFVDGRRTVAAFKGVVAVALTQVVTQIALSSIATVWAS